MNTFITLQQQNQSDAVLGRIQPMLIKQQHDAHENNPLRPPYLKGDIKGRMLMLRGDEEIPHF
jgi:hypothetical protein